MDSLTEDNTWRILSKPNKNKMRELVSAEAHRMELAGITFINGYWDRETLIKFLKGYCWSHDEYEDRYE